MNAVWAISETLASTQCQDPVLGTRWYLMAVDSGSAHTQDVLKLAWQEHPIYFDCFDFAVMAVLGSLIWRDIGDKIYYTAISVMIALFSLIIFHSFQQRGLRC